MVTFDLTKAIMHPSVVYRGSGSNTPHTACAYMLPPDTFVIACTKFDDVAIGRCSANRHVRKANSFESFPVCEHVKKSLR